MLLLPPEPTYTTVLGEERKVSQRGTWEERKVSLSRTWTYIKTISEGTLTEKLVPDRLPGTLNAGNEFTF